jgi:hypothetical protein
MSAPTDAVFLAAIDRMLSAIDERLPDASLAPKPYEVTAPEMRDVMRLARRQRPLTKAGREAWRKAVA